MTGCRARIATRDAANERIRRGAAEGGRDIPRIIES
jgi:hypothetical protein